MHAALQKETYPPALFEWEKVKNATILLGMLSIARMELVVEMPCKVDISVGRMSISGAHDIALEEFEIEPLTAVFGQVVLSANVTVTFELVFENR